MDSLILCKFLRGVFDGLLRRGADMLRRGHRLGRRPPTNSARRRGASSASSVSSICSPAGRCEEDTLPDRFLDTPLPNDPAAVLSREQLEALVAEYHRQRGW